MIVSDERSTYVIAHRENCFHLTGYGLFVRAGSSGSGFTITDSWFSSFVDQEFVPGSALSFLMNLTSNDDFGGVPDGFALYLLDSSGMPIPTKAPFADYFFSASFGSGGPVF